MLEGSCVTKYYLINLQKEMHKIHRMDIRLKGTSMTMQNVLL